MHHPGQDASALKLCDFLRARHREILDDWRISAASLPAARDLDGPGLMDHMPEVLACIADVTDEDSPVADLNQLPEVHALDRLDRGFDLRAVVTEFTLLKDVVLRRWLAHSGTLIPVDQMRRFDGAIAQAVTVSADRYARARERTLQALDRISQAALGTRDLQSFLQHLMRAVLETTEVVDFIAILLRDGDHLELQAALGLPEILQVRPRLRIGEGFAGLVAARGEPMFSRDASHDPLVTLDSTRSAGVRALYGIPLMHEDEVLGVAEVGSRTSFDFSPTDRLLFRTMSTRASGLLVQAQLMERERAARQQAEAAAARSSMLATASGILGSSLDRDQILRNLTRLAVPQVADAMTIDMLGADGLLELAAWANAEGGGSAESIQNYRRTQTISLSRSPLGQALLAGRTVHVREVTDDVLQQNARDPAHLEALRSLRMSSLIAVPLTQREKVTGMVMLIRRAPSKPFDVEDVQMARQLAQMVSLSLENARLIAEADSERRRLHGILQGLPVAVGLVEAPNGVILDVNAQMRRLVGDVPRGTPVLEFKNVVTRRPDGSEVPFEAVPLMRAMQGETVSPEEFQLVHPDGTRLDVLISAGPIRDGTGRVTAVTVAMIDISDRKRAETFQRNLTAIVGHDLRNPLQAVSLTTKSLLRRTDLGDHLVRPLRRIESSTDRMTRMVAEVLDFARVQLGGGVPMTQRQVDLCELSSRVADEFDTTHPGRLAVECPSAGLTVTLDPDRMGQVLSNLVGNALTHGAPDRPVQLRVALENSEVVLSVSNEGAPIPPALLATLFNPFTRARGSASEGLGLGLYISQHIVRAHGGRVEVESSDAGTTFRVRVPAGPAVEPS